MEETYMPVRRYFASIMVPKFPVKGGYLRKVKIDLFKADLTCPYKLYQ